MTQRHEVSKQYTRNGAGRLARRGVAMNLQFVKIQCVRSTSEGGLPGLGPRSRAVGEGSEGGGPHGSGVTSLGVGPATDQPVRHAGLSGSGLFHWTEFSGWTGQAGPELLF